MSTANNPPSTAPNPAPTAAEAAAQPTPFMDYSDALLMLKGGERLAREGWNGKRMFVFLVPGSVFKVNREPLLSILGEGTEVTYRPHIDIKNADGSIAVWVPSITDQMADDWMVVYP